MNKAMKSIEYIVILISGYFFIPGLYLGFILATNSSKGWSVQNEDGLLFVPVGILILSIQLSMMIAHSICLFSAVKNKNTAGYLSVGLHVLGILIYLINWGLSS